MATVTTVKASGTIERTFPLWEAKGLHPNDPAEVVRVRAATRSEARGLLKRHLKLDRLPPGLDLKRVAEG
jgi:hypothetical protein